MRHAHIPYSVLDLSPIVEGASASDAFRNTMDLTFAMRCSGPPRKTDPKGCNLNGAEQSVEVIAAGVVAKFVSRGDYNAMALARAPGSWTGCN